VFPSLRFQREGTNRLAVQLPGISQQDAKDLIGALPCSSFGAEARREQYVCQDSTGANFTVPADTVPDQSGDPRAAYIVTGCQW